MKKRNLCCDPGGRGVTKGERILPALMEILVKGVLISVGSPTSGERVSVPGCGFREDATDGSARYFLNPSCGGGYGLKKTQMRKMSDGYTG